MDTAPTMKQIKFIDLQETNIIHASQIKIELPSQPVHYYRHGWQSWSLAAWTNLNPFPVQMPAIFHPLQVDDEHVFNRTPHGSWLGAVEFEDGNILLLGALTTDAHVFLVDGQLMGQADASGGDWFVAYGCEQDVFEEYAAKLGDRFGRIKKNGIPRVWCSWYSLYTTIDEKILSRVFDELSGLSFDVLQVDDGWQMNIGDWDANSKFPSGMSSLAEKIKSTGRKAGLWLAPLIATRSSRLFRQHSDWFLRDERGRLVSAGFNWSEQIYALDTTHPGVTEWLTALMKQVRAWGFDYLKLDFLYAGALRGKRYKKMPREAAFRQCLQVMRDAMGADAFFLTCGTPIFPALGICDAIRIGPDVSHAWERHRDAHLLYNPSIPGTRNAIRTVVHRLWLRSLIHIDPDVAYFASKENSLTPEQKTLLQDLTYICNFKATSELPQWLTTDEREQVETFLNADPKIEQKSRYVFHLDGRPADFTSAVSLPLWPTGLITLWATFLGWLGGFPAVLRILKKFDDKSLKRRRANL